MRGFWDPRQYLVTKSDLPPNTSGSMEFFSTVYGLLVNTMGILLSLIVLATLYGSSTLRGSRHYVVIAQLLLVDLILAGAILVINSQSLWAGTFLFRSGRTACIVITHIEIFAFSMAVVLNTILAVDRYLTIVKGRTCSKKNLLLCAMGGWAFVAASMLILTSTLGVESHLRYGVWCTLSTRPRRSIQRMYIYILNGTFVLSMLVSGWCYVSVYRTWRSAHERLTPPRSAFSYDTGVSKSWKETGSSWYGPSQRSDSTFARETTDAVTLLALRFACIWATVYLCLLPVELLMLYETVTDTSVSGALDTLSVMLATTYTFLSPLILLVFDNNIKSVVRSWFGREEPDENAFATLRSIKQKVVQLSNVFI